MHKKWLKWLYKISRTIHGEISGYYAKEQSNDLLCSIEKYYRYIDSTEYGDALQISKEL